MAYVYDASGRRVTITETVTGKPTRLTDHDDDADGRVFRVANPEGEVHDGYNLLGPQVNTWTGPSGTPSSGLT